MGHSGNSISIHENAVDFAGASASIVRAAAGPAEQSRYFPAGHSAQMENVRRTIGEVASSLVPVLITGEAGAGKERAARYMHASSPRRDQAFIAVDCAALSSEQLERQIFGQDGAAAGDTAPVGQSRVEAARGGTLFLDDISSLDADLFGSLLKAVRQRSYRRIGGSRSRPCDVRLIAAADSNGRGVSETYKSLFYGVPAAHIEMPPLRERAEDLDDLVENISLRVEEFGLDVARLTPGALRILKHYDWPGNVRELAGLMERLSLLYPGQRVDIADLPVQYTENVPLRMNDRLGISAKRAVGPRPQDIDLPSGRVHLKQYIEEIEIALIRRALRETNGVIAHAARYLHLRRTTLAEKIKRYGLRETSEADAGAAR